MKHLVGYKVSVSEYSEFGLSISILNNYISSEIYEIKEDIPLTENIIDGYKNMIIDYYVKTYSRNENTNIDVDADILSITKLEN